MAQQPQTVESVAMQMGDMTGDYYPEPHGDITGGLPINLDSLRDGPPGTKPFYPYSTLIRYAIKGSPGQKLLLEDIYYAIESRFPYFRSAPSGWKNSVRHNLSLNPCFEKVPRPLTDRGKGSYWIVNDNVDPRTGVHRVRKKKGHKSSKASVLVQQEDETDLNNYTHTPEDVAMPPAPVSFENGAFEPPPPVMQPDPVVQQQYVYAPMLQQTQPEVDENGIVNWRAAWLNELAKLQHITAEQDKLQADPDWYREMLFRVRTAMMAPIDVNGVLQIANNAAQAAVPPPETHDQT